jgi:hypothetical protein
MRYELKPLGVGGILDQAIRIFKDRFVLFLLIMMCLEVPLNFVTAYSVERNSVKMSAHPTPAEMDAAFRSQGRSFVLFLPLLLLNMFIVTPITNAAIVHATANVYLGKPTGIGDAVRVALGRFFPFVWTSFLFGLVVFLGTLACFVPGIIFFFRYFLATDIVVIERTSGWAAMRRSRELMVSHRTKHYNTAFLLLLIVGIINFGVQQGTIHLIPDPLVATLVAAVLQGVAFAFSLIAVVVFYFSCRCRAENFDLVQLAESVAAGPEEQAAGPGEEQEGLAPQ